jgi:signal transduction histidine kinase
VRRHPDRIIRLVARPLGVGPGPSRLLTAMFDVTEERRLESERAAALEREQQRGEELAREVAIRTRAEERVKALLERLVSVQEEERRRIARNLHDHLGQQMTALRLSIGALKDHTLSPAELRGRLDAIDKIAAQIDRDVDFLAWDLRPAALDDVGLTAALETIVRDWSATNGIDAEFHGSPEAARLAAESESHLYRIVQEALNNVSKHAAATHVSVLLEQHDSEVRLIIEDDGRGFDPERAAAALTHRGLGLTSMQERAALIGGHVEFESAPGQGTTVFARVPIRATTASRG